MSYSIFCNLVDELVKNLPPSNTQEIDLILDNGAFNGLYLFGILIYIKKLESLKKIKINKISGSSIGSAFAVLYLIDRLDLTESIYDNMRTCWKDNCNLHIWKDILISTLENFITMKEITEKINDKIYINYFDTKKCVEIIKSNFSSKEELIETLYKSSFIPILINGDLSYDNCIDGFNPTLFDKKSKEDNKCLFIHLIQFNNIIKALNLANDKNTSFRAVEGINTIHKFFLGEKQNLCSYVNNWSIKELLFYRFRQIIYLLIVYFISLVSVLKKNIPNSLYETPIYNLIREFTQKIYKDVMIKICF